MKTQILISQRKKNEEIKKNLIKDELDKKYDQTLKEKDKFKNKINILENELKIIKKQIHNITTEKNRLQEENNKLQKIIDDMIKEKYIFKNLNKSKNESFAICYQNKGNKKLKNYKNIISNSHSLLTLPFKDYRININREDELLQKIVKSMDYEITKLKEENKSLNWENKNLKKFIETSQLVDSQTDDLPENLQFHINNIICNNSSLSILSEQNNTINNEKFRELENLDNGKKK